MPGLDEHSKEDKTVGRDATGVVAGKRQFLKSAASPGAKTANIT